MAAIVLIAALALNHAARKFPLRSSVVVENILSLLPQTQCGQCGYPGCRPYAEAIAEGEAINLCPPGGQHTLDKLAQLLGTPPVLFDNDRFDAGNDISSETRIAKTKVAKIIERDCIGCGFCKTACPVDAIIGAIQHMHTVIESECTGCDLCLDPCPVDCIEMI